MRMSLKILGSLLIYAILGIGMSAASTTANQTDELSPILPGTELPFRIVIEQANFELPVGIHSGAIGVYKGWWVLIGGRLNGLHGFGGVDAFPALFQNKNIYVVNSVTGEVFSRALDDSSSGLTQAQVDFLSVTSPEFYQAGTTLYIAGGYGIDTENSVFSTKPVLTALNLPGIIDWVIHPANRSLSVKQNMSQISHPIFQITGGKMIKLGNLTQLIFGQNFDGNYTDSSNGEYAETIRQFEIQGNNGQMAVKIYPSRPLVPDSNFRRRDLNVLPVLLNNQNLLQYGLVAYAGVFTPASGIWTVPVVIRSTGDPIMADPDLSTTFKQGMNHYACATVGLYSRKETNMYHIFFGGMSYGYFSGGSFQTDAQIPFINQITTIKMDNNGQFKQYLMDSEYPEILSTSVNPGNPLLFGAGAYFVVANISQYANRVINLDRIRQPTVIGYIVGGIASTLPNTSSASDSFASRYIFKVTLVPR